MEAPEYIYVMANPRTTRMDTNNGVFLPLSPGQCALLEEDEEHPYDAKAGVHRVFVVAGRPPVLAAQTGAVQQRLLEKQIIIVQRDKAEKMIADYKSEQQAARAARVAQPRSDQIAEDEYEASISSPSPQARKASRAAKRAVQPAPEQAIAHEDS
jgi:hypothetical protein